MTATATPLSPIRSRRFRLLVVTGFAVLGFLVLWQFFAVLGFGSTTPTLPTLIVLILLFVAGRRFTRAGESWRNRVSVGLLAVALSCVAWWFVPAVRSGLSRWQAIAIRSEVRERLSSPDFDYIDLIVVQKKSRELHRDYRDLARECDDEFKTAGERFAIVIAARIWKLPKNDLVAFQKLDDQARQLLIIFGSNPATSASSAWVRDAVELKVTELNELAPGDWLAFNHTAAGRRELFELKFLAEDDLIAAEAAWVEESVRELIAEASKAPKPVARDHWQRIHAELLALKSVDTSEGRFSKARAELFAVAHQHAQQQVGVHLQRGQFDLAYGVARAHAVEWDETAALAGRRLHRELHSTRLVCQYLAHIYSNLTPPPDPEEIAPPPRAKPEKQPEKQPES